MFKDTRFGHWIYHLFDDDTNPEFIGHTSDPKENIKVEETVASVDPMMRRALDKFLVDSTRPAYAEYLNIDAMLSITLTDESARTQATIATLEAKGFTFQSVVDAIDEAMRLLEVEKHKGLSMSEIARGTKIDKPKLQIDILNEQIIELETKLAQITIQRNILISQMNRDEDMMNDADAKFIFTVEALKNQLAAQRVHLNSIKR